MATTQRAGIENMKLFRWRMPGRSLAIVASAAIAFGITSTAGVLGRDTLPPREENAAATAKPNFDKVGPQVGDQLPDLKLRTIKGEPQRLGDAWRGGPALVVTSSFTCPKSRSRWPELKKIVDTYGEKLNVVIVYVIEAHPVGSVCPYKGVEEITPENQRDGILRHQPKTLEDRLDLAQEFKRYLRVDAPIYVDTINDQAWKAFGAAPNIAFLVDTDGIVAARQGWFDGEGMEKAIEKSLIKSPVAARHERHWPRMSVENEMKSEAELERTGLNIADISRGVTTSDLKRALKKNSRLANIVVPYVQVHARETTLLMEAVQHRNLAAAELLLSSGADVKVRTSSFDSALQLAAQIGQPEMLKLLIRHHSEVNFPPTGASPLHEALIAGHLDAARLLIEAGAKEDFWSNVGLGKLDSVRKVLAADPSWVSRPDGAGRMPLDYAAANSQLEMAKLQLNSGAPIVDDEFSHMQIPLHYAIARGNAPLVELLLNAGSSANTALRTRGEDPDTTPPLHMAISADNAEIVRILLAHKADPERRNTYSQTALHYAAEEGKPEISELLVKAGADVNALQLQFSLPCGSGEEETPAKNTPLHFAAARGNPATIKVLLDAGAKIDAVNVKGLTPLMSAIEPPLYTGINEKSRLKNMELLLSSGANVNARDANGLTVLDHAKSAQHAVVYQVKEDVIDLLRKHGAKTGEPKGKK
jgi:ankyrin repeat protein